MAKIDLKSLSLKELIALGKRVETAIGRHEKKAKTEALAAVKAKAKEMGFSLEDLTGDAPSAKPGKKTKGKAAARKAPKIRYRDPKNPKNVWGGRGPKPQWIKDAVAAGKSQDDFKV